MKKVFFIFCFLIFLFSCLPAPVFASEKVDCDISFSFLSAYKKTMLHWDELQGYVKKYEKKYCVKDLGVLVLVVAMYESGGNYLMSSAGARGIMQVMPKTQKFMKVKNINEAGVKYLAYLSKRFEKYYSGAELKSKVIQAYNGGPGRVTKGLVKIETFQYLQGVSLYYNLYCEQKDTIERLAKNLNTAATRTSKSWQELSDILKVPVCELRIYNPFLAGFFSKKKVPGGNIIVYPKEGTNLFLETSIDATGSRKFFYVTRRGDIIHHLANVFGYDYEQIRKKTDMLLWSVLYSGKKIDITDSPYLAKPRKQSQ